MKKLIIFGIIGVVVVGGGIAYVAVVGLPTLGLGFLDGEKREVKRGDMRIPITAVGKVEAAKLIEIKSKASGQLIRIHTVAGAMVTEGDILAELDPVDERRNVERGEASLARVTSMLEKARITLEDLKYQLPANTAEAEERLKDATATTESAEHTFLRIKNLHARKQAPETEFINARSSHRRAQAAKRLAEIALGRARNNEITTLKQAEQDIIQAQANVREATTSLDDANQRLSETTIVAPSNAMVYSILRKEGEMIQSGTMTLGGGTPIMYLADIGSMFVMAQVDEADIGVIRDIAPEYARPGKTQRLSEEDYKNKGQNIIERWEDAKDAETGSDSDNAGGTNGHSDESDGDKHKEYDHTQDDADSELVPATVRDELEGRPVKVTVEAYRGEEFQGVIERILPDPVQTGGSIAFRVRIRLFGDDVQKLMGLQADLSFETKLQKDVLLIPNDALRSEGTECYVWIPHKNNPGDRRWDKKKIPVEIGETDGVNTVIFDGQGLKAGDEVWIKTPILTDREKKNQGG